MWAAELKILIILQRRQAEGKIQIRGLQGHQKWVARGQRRQKIYPSSSGLR